MKEDKTLVCKECGKEFVFSASEQEFYESKASVRNARCIRRFALNAAKKPKFRSNLPKTVRFTAVTATTHITENNKQIQPAVKMRQVFCLFQRIL